MDSNKKLNYYSSNIEEIGEGFVIIKKRINFEKDKTTPKGEYPKLNSNDKCAYPERACCNYGEFFIRCPNMKYNQQFNNWFCNFKEDKK